MIFPIECPYCGTEMDLEAEGAELKEIEDDAGAMIACEGCTVDTEYDLIDGQLVAIVEGDDSDDTDEDEPEEEEPEE